VLPDDCLLKPYPVDLPWKHGMPASALETSLDVLPDAPVRASARAAD
jgi:ectoine hydroxylase